MKEPKDTVRESGLSSKGQMAIILESPPYCPIDDEAAEIWAILNMLGYYHVKIIKYEKHVQVVFTHKPWLKNEGSNVEKAEVLDLRWAFRHLEGVALPLVRKVFDELRPKETVGVVDDSRKV